MGLNVQVVPKMAPYSIVFLRRMTHLGGRHVGRRQKGTETCSTFHMSSGQAGRQCCCIIPGQLATMQLLSQAMIEHQSHANSCVLQVLRCECLVVIIRHTGTSMYLEASCISRACPRISDAATWCVEAHHPRKCARQCMMKRDHGEALQKTLMRFGCHL